MVRGEIGLLYLDFIFYKKMLFGVDSPGLVKFLIQASAAVAGAASLWIFIFYLKKQLELARILIPLFMTAVLIFVLSWIFAVFFVYPQGVAAHEGLRLVPAPEFVAGGLNDMAPFVLLAALLTLWGVFTQKYNAGFFAAQFILWSIIISTTVNTGFFFTREQIFYALHGWHSIFTLGTVIAVDFLFVATKKRDELKRFLYNFFPFMSAAIWTGLGIDFLANLLIFKEAFGATGQFLFTQTTVAIIIINGALLSGKINGWMINLLRADGTVANFTPRQQKIAEISAAVSITSWLTITFVDGFTLTASYYQMFVVYLLVIILIYLLKHFAETGIKKLAVAGKHQSPRSESN